MWCKYLPRHGTTSSGGFWVYLYSQSLYSFLLEWVFIRRYCTADMVKMRGRLCIIQYVFLYVSPYFCIKYQRHADWQNSLQHLLPLPFFLTLAPNIYDHWNFALASEPIRLPVIGVHMPSLVAYLIGNILTQYPFLNTVIFILYYVQTRAYTQYQYIWRIYYHKVFSLTVLSGICALALYLY